jgi:hypothetical protein
MNHDKSAHANNSLQQDTTKRESNLDRMRRSLAKWLHESSIPLDVKYHVSV